MKNKELYNQYKDFEQNQLNKEAMDLSIKDLTKNENSEALKYLLVSSEIKKNANVHFADDYIFKVIYTSKNFEILKFLIFDLKIEKTKDIISHLDDYYDKEINKLFDLRDLNEKLDSDLNDSKINSKKIKI